MAFAFDRPAAGASIGACFSAKLAPPFAKKHEAYLRDRGVELHADAFLFCTRSGSHYREATLAHDFAAVRELVLPGDRRRLMRRSGAAEAVAGQAEPGTLSAKMANSIESSNVLHKTYSPVDLASVRSADAARLRGRRRMREENE